MALTEQEKHNLSKDIMRTYLYGLCFETVIVEKIEGKGSERIVFHCQNEGVRLKVIIEQETGTVNPLMNL